MTEETPSTALAKINAEGQARIDAYVCTDPETLAKMVKGASIEVCEIIAANPAASAKTLDTVARRSRATFRSKVWTNLAENPNTSSGTLEWISRKVDKAMLTKRFLNVISNQEFGFYDEIMIHASIGTNPSTPLHILRKYAENKYHAIRFGVTSNPTLPLEERVALLIPMATEGNPAGGTIMFPPLDHPDLPADVREKKLAELCADENQLMWEEVAKMKHLNLETVKVLKGANSDEVKESLYSNTQLPERAYKVLSQTNDFHLLQVLAENPATPENLIKGWVQETLDAFAEIERLKQYEFLALAISKNPMVTKDTLIELAQGSEGHVSEGVQQALTTAVEDNIH